MYTHIQTHPHRHRHTHRHTQTHTVTHMHRPPRIQTHAYADTQTHTGTHTAPPGEAEGDPSRVGNASLAHSGLVNSTLSHKRRQEDSSLVIKDKVLSWTKAFLRAGLFANNGTYSQSYGFSSIMYTYESWTKKKAEHQRTDAFQLWWWRQLWRVPWTARRSNQSVLKEISPEYSLEGLMLKLKLQYFAT